MSTAEAIVHSIGPHLHLHPSLVSATVASSYCFSASHQLANGQKVHQLLLLVEVGAVVVACLPLPLLQPLLGAPLPQSQAEEAPLTVEGGASFVRAV
jgi:hypothetical protein